MSTGFEPQGGTDLSTLSLRQLRKRFAADTGESASYDTMDWSTFRSPTSRGLFGGVIDDRELLFAVQREPAAFRIVHGVARDVLDNWFEVKLQEGDDDGSLNKLVQTEMDRLQAKTKLIRLLSLSRLFGYSILLLGYDDNTPELDTPMEDPVSKIKYIEPYGKMEINRIKEVDDPDDDRDGYPEFFFMKKSAGFTSTNIQVHYTRAIFCSTLLVDHRYKGRSVLECLYDDITGFRYMRWGFYMTMIRYGSGFPDVTLKGPEADQAAVDAFIASGQFDNLNSMKYFVHNEQQQLDFKGTPGATLNPGPYYQMALETLALGSGVPEPTLRGAQAGALTGSEVNERNYFKIISDEQTTFESVLRQLIDRILMYLGEGTVEKPVDYKIVWKPSYEPTQEEKARLDQMNASTAQAELQFKSVDEVRQDRFKLPPLPKGGSAPPTPDELSKLQLSSAQTAQLMLLCQTVDEVRKTMFNLPPLPDGQGTVVMGLGPQVSQTSSGSPMISRPSTALAQEGSVLSPSFAQGSTGSKDVQQAPPLDAGEGNPQKDAGRGADQEQTETPSEMPAEKSVSRTLPLLLQDLGKEVMTGKLRKDEAMARGKDIITEYARLEQEHALLWVKHRSRFPGVVVIPPEMQQKLTRQRARFLDDLDAMLSDAEKLFKQRSSESSPSSKKSKLEAKP
jgi:hypothetical protein